MTFLMGSSLLMVGLLTASIPIIIHLLHRQKTLPLQWGAMMFLKQSPLQMKRRKQVDHWLLMLLRMAALALLAWLLARPLLKHSKFNPLATNQPADIAVVLDHSMSMGRHSGDHTLLDEANSVVDRLTDAQNPVLRPGDTFAVVLAEHRPRELTPVPLGVRDTSKLAEVRAQLRQLKPGTTDCSIPEAVESAREVLNRGRKRAKSCWWCPTSKRRIGMSAIMPAGIVRWAIPPKVWITSLKFTATRSPPPITHPT